MIYKVNIPGLRNSSEDHWQTILEHKLGEACFRVHQENWEAPDCETWIQKIESELVDFDKAQLILIGHSIGCMAIVKWIERFNHKIKGALLVAPSDSERLGYPTFITGFTPIPSEKLSFPSIVIASSNDHVTTLDRSKKFAKDWGSELIILENAGHIEPKSGFGDWQEILELIEKLEK